MGILSYDGEKYEMEDRLLAHLQIVISLKLRRSESFFLSWARPHGHGGGRFAIWISDGVPIRLVFAGSLAPIINREWAERMALSANSGHGLVITDEVVPSED